MNKPIDRGKYKMLYNESSNKTKQRKWLKRTVGKLRRLNMKDQVRSEVERLENNSDEVYIEGCRE